MRKWRRNGTIALAIVGLLSACQAPPAQAPAAAPRAAEAPAPRLVAWPVARRATEVAGTGRSLSGSATLTVADVPALASSAAYRALAVAAGSALVSAATLDESLLAIDGSVIGATTDAAGAFRLDGVLPPDFPFVVSATLAYNHRLSAIVLPGQPSVTLDEVSSAVAETARYQVRAGLPNEGGAGPTLANWTLDALSALTTASREFVTASALGVTTSPPRIEALELGAGTRLRHALVGAFGRRVTASGDTAADRLSDRWKALLGVRPLAVERVAGGGAAMDDGGDATAAQLLTPIDAVSDADGNLYLTEQDSHLVRFVPKSSTAGFGAHPGAMSAGKIYTVAGLVNGPRTLDDFNAIYRPWEAAAAADPAQAPPVYDATNGLFPLLSPYRLVLEATSARPHMFFTSLVGNRVLLVPGADFTRFGRSFKAGKLYTIAGTGEVAPDAASLGDGGAAITARLYGPRGLARDALGNLYVLDAGAAGNTAHGRLRVVDAATGGISTLALTQGGQTLSLVGVSDVRLVESGAGNALYLADAPRHQVIRVPLPADLHGVGGRAIAVETVLGTAGKAGFTSGAAPQAATANAGMAEGQVLLDTPTSLAFDAAGNLLVADAGNGRIRLLEKAGLTGDGLVYTIAGGFALDALEGDTRLAMFPSTSYMNLEGSGNVLVVDRRENLVRRLWTIRGSL